MEDKIVIKEVGTVANPQRFANRIEPVNDKEVNVALFSLYDWLIAPVKDIEAEVDKIKENLREIRYIDGRSHHAGIKFIIFYIVFFLGFAIYLDSDHYASMYEKCREDYLEYGYLTYGSDSEGLEEFLKDNYYIVYQARSDWGWATVPAYLSVTPIIILYFLERRIDKKRIKKIKKKNQDIEDVITQKVQAIEKEVSFVPPKYRHSRALQYFVESYENSRVNNLYEAVNAYDTYEHRKNVEIALAEISIQLQQIAYNQVETINQLKALRRDVWLSGAIF